jgi:hypothetical protein
MKINNKIAVAVVGALAFAGISALPSQAAPTLTYTTMYDTTNGIQAVNGLATLTVHTDTSTVDNVVLTGVGSILQVTAGSNDTVTINPAPTVTGGVNNWFQLTNGAGGSGSATVIIYSQNLGTSTLTITPINAGTGVAGTAVTKTVTWTSTGSLAANAGYSTAYIASSSTTPTSTTDATPIIAVDNAGTTAGTEVANIQVQPKDSNGNSIANDALTVTVSGPGLIGIGASAGSVGMQGRAVTGTAGNYNVNVFGDGTAGTSTITVSDGSTVLASKTLVFGGLPATFTSSNEFGVYRIGSNGADNVSTTLGSGIAVSVKDANGNPVPNGTTVYAVSNTPTVATISSSATTTGGVAYFGVTGVSVGTASFSFNNEPVGTTVTATSNDTLTVNSSVASSVTLAFDNSTYANGTVVKLKLTALAANGLPISDVAAAGYSYTNLLSADLVSSVALGGASLSGSATPTFTNGVATWNLYAPLSAGPFQVVGKTGTATGLSASAQGVSLTASATVADPNASQNATNASAIQTLTTTVQTLQASIQAQVTALNMQLAQLQAQLIASTKSYNALVKKYNAQAKKYHFSATK